MKVDVIIPVYKPGKELFSLIEKLQQQSMGINQIILMNTERQFFDEKSFQNRILEKYHNVSVYHLSKKEFDHGKTRHTGVTKSEADVFVMLTQDAMPANEFLIEKLVAHLKDDVASAYGRQLATKNSSVLEKFTRQFNYPKEGRLQSKEDLERLGIKTYFCSNVCAAYRRDVYDKLGGFVHKTIFNEDMIYAAAVIKAGYKISYEPEAMVYHSHNYTNMQQLHRNFDLGVSQAEHPEVFANVKSESEGKRMVKQATQYLKENKLRRKIPYFYSQCGFKYMGYLLGKKYKLLPKWLIKKLTMNKEYWNKE